MSKVGDYRKIVETACPECLVDVRAWRPDWAGFGEVIINLRSDHTLAYALSLRGRLALAWSALWGRPWNRMGAELVTRRDADDVIAALREAADTAFPS